MQVTAHEIIDVPGHPQPGGVSVPAPYRLDDVVMGDKLA